jgi:cytochrome P450
VTFEADRLVEELVKEQTFDALVDPAQPVVRWDHHGGCWLVTGHEALVAATRDTETFSSRHELPNGSSPYKGVMEPATPILAVPIEVDPPLHQEYRKLLNPHFSPIAVREMAPRLEQFTTWCIDQWIEDGRADLYHGLCKLVPAMMTLDLLGLPLKDAATFADTVQVRRQDRFKLEDSFAVPFRRMMAAVAARRPAPRDDLISRLLASGLRGRDLTDMELVEICFTIVTGGIATTARLLLGALSYLGAHPAERARLIEDPSLVPTAIEEFLRYYSPVPYLSRTATRDVCFYGQEIKAGDRVAVGYAVANRDPKMFDDASDVRLDRTPNRHVALGHGNHFCIGSGMGRTEAVTMVEQVLRRIPDYRIDAEAWAAAEEAFDGPNNWEAKVHRGLPVEFGPGPRIGGPDLHLDPGV